MNTHTKGSVWRRATQHWLDELGAHTRFRSIGEAGDDITAKLGDTEYSVECKNVKSITLSSFVDQANGNALPHQVPVVFIKRRGRVRVGDGYVVMSADHWARMAAVCATAPPLAPPGDVGGAGPTPGGGA